MLFVLEMATSIINVSFHACPFLYAVICCYVFGTYFIVLCLMSTSTEREFETCYLSWSCVCTDALLLLNDSLMLNETFKLEMFIKVILCSQKGFLKSTWSWYFCPILVWLSVWENLISLHAGQQCCSTTPSHQYHLTTVS